MADFALDQRTLLRLCKQNDFRVPESGLMIFGFRGAIPTRPDSAQWQRSAPMVLAQVDHTHPRCTIAILDVDAGGVMALLGTTVPHKRYIEQARRRGGLGANQNLTGAFTVTKGPHPWSGKTSHRALRQKGVRPLIRTADDLRFELGDDRIEFGETANNLHCMWCMGPAHAYFASAGCSGPTGYPKCPARGAQPSTGGWAALEKAVYEVEGKNQDDFAYIILGGADPMYAAENATISARVRFGSWNTKAGSRPWRVQEALIREGYLKGQPDGKFGQASTLALMAAQTNLFGPDADDGICGPATATVLGITAWETL